MLHLMIKRDFKELPGDCFNDFLALENYFHQSVNLRLRVPGAEAGLKEAHDISTIITSKWKCFRFFLLMFIGRNHRDFEQKI